MNVREAATAAKQRVGELFAPGALRDVRMENCVYDDHFLVWTLTIGYALAAEPDTRGYKIVRVSEADKSVLSVRDP